MDLSFKIEDTLKFKMSIGSSGGDSSASKPVSAALAAEAPATIIGHAEMEEL